MKLLCKLGKNVVRVMFLMFFGLPLLISHLCIIRWLFISHWLVSLLYQNAFVILSKLQSQNPLILCRYNIVNSSFLETFCTLT